MTNESELQAITEIVNRGLETLRQKHVEVIKASERSATQTVIASVDWFREQQHDDFQEAQAGIGALGWAVESLTDAQAPLSQLRFRALVEVLLGTGARISEVLSLNRSDVNFEGKEAKIIGKGRKERMLFFTDRALEWLGRYLSCRLDEEDPLFVTRGDLPCRLSYDVVKNVFKRVNKRARLRKTTSAHVLRHTFATTLLFNGCPIGHIKELLGHQQLDTTCRYYLGADIRAAKGAHQKFLRYE